MPEVTSNPPGTFCWIELGTSDTAAAKEFYTTLFGWTTREQDLGEMGTYNIFQKNGRDAAAMYQIGPTMQEMPPNWMSYISVASADEAAAKAKQLGATVLDGPFNVDTHGRMAVLRDPQGAHFCVWQPLIHPGVGIRDEAGTLCWNELQARDVAAAKTFYAALVGWTMKETPEYTEWHAGQQPVGGMMQSQAPPEVPSYWMPYFAVDDCDATTKAAMTAGAAVFAGPMDYPGVGRFSIMCDPQGAVFAVIRLDLSQHG